MAVMSIAEAWPAAGRPFTVAELDRMPDDGHRYELLDGTLIVSPRPTNPHQEVAMELAVQLRRVCPRDLRADRPRPQEGRLRAVRRARVLDRRSPREKAVADRLRA